MAKLVVTLLGSDRTGLVDELSSAIVAHGGNWSRSNLARLAGKFAGIVEIEVSAERRDDLVAALEAIDAAGALDLTVEDGRADAWLTDDEPVAILVIGQDRPGIVQELARALAEHAVNIVAMETSVTEAPMSGGGIFTADVSGSVRAGQDTAALLNKLDTIAAELGVDIEVA